MDCVVKPEAEANRYSPLDVSGVSVRTVKRDIEFLISENSEPLKITLEAADSSNDENWLIQFFYKLFRNDSEKIADKAQKLDSLNHVIYHKLCDVDLSVENPAIEIIVKINSKETKVTLASSNNEITVQVGDGDPIAIRGGNLERLRDELGKQIVARLKSSIDKLSTNDHRIAWIESNSDVDWAYGAIHTKNTNPDYATLCKINVGDNDTSNTGTIVRRDDNMFAATVVAGPASRFDPEESDILSNLPTYSGAVTAAVMRAVEVGARYQNLPKEELDSFLRQTILLVLTEKFAINDQTLLPNCKGVIYYKQEDGVDKRLQFEFINRRLFTTVRDLVPGGDVNNMTRKDTLVMINSVNKDDFLEVTIDVLDYILGRDEFDVFSRYALEQKGKEKIERCLLLSPDDYLGNSAMSYTKSVNIAKLSDSEEMVTRLTAQILRDIKSMIEAGEKLLGGGLRPDQIRELKRTISALQKKISEDTASWKRVAASLASEIVILDKLAAITPDEKAICENVGGEFQLNSNRLEALKSEQFDLLQASAKKTELENRLIEAGLMKIVDNKKADNTTFKNSDADNSKNGQVLFKMDGIVEVYLE